jgi:UDP-glucose 4-epimerase
VRGAFHSFEDLRALDDHDFDVAVHLAGVLGGCREAEAMRVNVEGSRRLMRYLVDRGCRKFALASSIAAIGIRSTAFRPHELPVTVDHPILARSPYCVSKHLMEELSRYFSRSHDDLDVTNLRLGSLFSPEDPPEPTEPGELEEWAFSVVGWIGIPDAVQAFMRAVEADHEPGERVFNVVGPDSGTTVPVPELMESWYPDHIEDLNLSHYERPGYEYAPVFAMDRTKEKLGFEPELSILDE